MRNPSLSQNTWIVSQKWQNINDKVITQKCFGSWSYRQFIPQIPQELGCCHTERGQQLSSFNTISQGNTNLMEGRAVCPLLCSFDWVARVGLKSFVQLKATSWSDVNWLVPQPSWQDCFVFPSGGSRGAGIGRVS